MRGYQNWVVVTAIVAVLAFAVAGPQAPELALAGGLAVLGPPNPPGSGETLLARSLPFILPRLSLAEALDVTRIYSDMLLAAAYSGRKCPDRCHTIGPIIPGASLVCSANAFPRSQRCTRLRMTAALPGRRLRQGHHAELLQHAQHVEFRPFFLDLAVFILADVNRH